MNLSWGEWVLSWLSFSAVTLLMNKILEVSKMTRPALGQYRQGSPVPVFGEKFMPEKNVDPREGRAPHKHKFALLLIDVINDFDFPEADQLLKHARPMAQFSYA